MNGFLFTTLLLFQIQAGVQVETGTVTGRLLSETGTPASGVRMAAIPVGDDNAAPVLVGITQTDEEGRYRLEDIPPGRYYVFAGLIDFPNYYPGTISLAEARVITVDPGISVADIDFMLPRPTAMKVSGRLTTPPSSGMVQLALEPRGQPNRSTVLTAMAEADGSFLFPQVAPGEYRVTTRSRGSIPVNVSVEDHDVEGVSVPFVNCGTGVSVRGRVVGQAASAIRQIQLRGQAYMCTISRAVGGDGSFVVDALPDDSYLIDVIPLPMGWSPANLRVEGENVEGVEIALPRTFEISGRIAVDDGSPVPRLARGAAIPVEARSDAARVFGLPNAVTQGVDLEGFFSMRLVQGRYTIALSALPTGYYVKSMTVAATDLKLHPLEVREGLPVDIQVILGLEHPVESGARVSGRVIPASRGALRRPESVLLMEASGGRNATFFTASLDGDGAFEFRGIEPGQYELHTFPDSPTSLRAIRVGALDVTGLELEMPVLFKLDGAIEWVQVAAPVAINPPASVSIQFQTRSGSDGRVSSWAAYAQSDAFQVYLPEGDYYFSITGIPEGARVASATFGNIDLLERQLHIGEDLDPARLQVTVQK